MNQHSDRYVAWCDPFAESYRWAVIDMEVDDPTHPSGKKEWGRFRNRAGAVYRIKQLESGKVQWE